jgi:predicted transcriptional regulator
MPNSSVFLDTFAAIEQHLSQVCGAGRHLPFYQLVDQASRSVPAVQAYRDDLRQFADLRNAIVHERRGGMVLAEPSDRVVADIQRIETLIRRPPTVAPAFQRTVTSLRATDSIGAAVKLMAERSYSQLPISGPSGFAGLLTANTVTEWLGANVAADIFSLRETTIAEVLKHTEPADAHVFLSRRATLYEVLEQFHKAEAQGKRLNAVLVTENGRPTEALMGIVTVSDLPELLGKLKL